MSDRKLIDAVDVAALTKDTDVAGEEKLRLTESERNDGVSPKPLVKIVNYRTGDVTQASLAQLNQQMHDFKKVILLIEDQPAFSDACTKDLHELGYDGVQLITHMMEAENHLDDIVSSLTEAPAAIVLDLGLGMDSGFTLLRNVTRSRGCRRFLFLSGQNIPTTFRKCSANILGSKIFW
jgi:CheY-like chemotaxis protein